VWVLGIVEKGGRTRKRGEGRKKVGGIMGRKRESGRGRKRGGKREREKEKENESEDRKEGGKE
jgi:hypothetical protein